MNRLNSKCVCNQAASHVIYNLHRFFTVKSESIRSSKKILNHFKVKNQESILDLFPNELKSSICKAEPKSVYVADEDAAKTIANAISKHHNKSVPFLECNPGPGILTKSLINHLDLDALRLIESNSNFNAIQTEFISSQSLPISIKYFNFVSINNGDVVNFAHDSVQPKLWHAEIVAQMFICITSIYVIHSLVKAVIHQNRLFEKGRIEIFATLPVFKYQQIMAGVESSYIMYNYYSCIFQILFECEILGKIPKNNFLPWWNPKYSRNYAIENKLDDDSFYLIRFVPRKDLLTLSKAEDLTALAYFVSQCFFKRRASIIPKLEKWVPGIGLDLITSHNVDFSNINVFSEFGTLSPSQTFSLFLFFRNSREYQSSSFHQQVKDFYEKDIKSTNADSGDAHDHSVSKI